MPTTKAAGGGIFSGVFQQGCQGTSQGQEDFELSWYLFFQHKLSKYLLSYGQSTDLLASFPSFLLLHLESPTPG